MKRTFALLSVLAIAGLILAACATPTAAPQPTAPPEGQPTSPPAPPAAMGTIKIASQSPLSGPQSVLGVAIKQGAELALEQLGGPLRDMGYSLELVPYDDQATPDVGVANAKNLVADPETVCFVGHLNSGVAIPSSEEYHTAGLAMVSPANTNINITDREYLEVNRIVGRDDVQGKVGGAFAAGNLGISTAYVIHDKTAYGQGVAEFFRREAEVQGINVLGFEGTEEQANFDAIITPILAANPEAIYFGGIYSQAGVFFKQARDKGYEGIFLGPDGMDSSELATLAGDALVTGGGMYYSTVAGPAETYPATAQFIEDYQAKFGMAVEPFGAQAYDSMGICLQAIETAIEAAGGLPTRAQVAEAVRATENYEGITGTLTFNDKGDLEVAKYFVIKVVSADPAAWGSNELIQVLDISPE